LAFWSGGFMGGGKDKLWAGALDMFCDLACRFAEMPREESLDGSQSCRTFVALYCSRKESLVHKNAPCKFKKRKAEATKKKG
jgi:hypothetical protein